MNKAKLSKDSLVILVQPPFAQLNSPYPAPYYLKSFLEKMGRTVIVLDHSIALFEKIFSSCGLQKVFEDAAHPQAGSSGPVGAAQPVLDDNKRRIAERFLSESSLWINLIERLTAFLRGKDPEFGHFIALANGVIPGGPRTDAYLEKTGGEINASEAKIFATHLLSDLADFITCVLDPSFSLVRYAPVMEASLASGFRDFAAVQKNLDGYIMNAFYRPFLNEEWTALEKNASEITRKANAPFLLAITIPFPGCLSGALVCADSAKKHFASAVITMAGGGFVNTELRFLNNKAFFDYFDHLSFDKGYASLLSVLDNAAQPKINEPALDETILIEEAAVKTNFPDYSSVDFDRYLCPVDDCNPMHRLWSDGHWMKAYLAHGCYWHSCAFCDVTLDYIKNFIPVDTAALFEHLKSQAKKTGVRGIHLCDEAAPVSSLLEFAARNREAGLPLNFWGNIRLDKGFTPDAAAILAAGGLIGVSAGLEVATERGFKATGKGIDLESAVKCLASFKEAGILTHAYLIYGYWDEDEQEIIDSAEILRQLFEAGLLDSAFWHKFILTRHSRIYAEKQRGLHPDLQIKDDITVDGASSGAIFALNDLSFEGEKKFDKYTAPLDTLLSAWMAGKTETPVSAAFPFKVKAPSVSPDLVTTLLDTYAQGRDKDRIELPSAENSKRELNKLRKALFLGSLPRLRQNGKKLFLFWRWRLQERRLELNDAAEAEKLTSLLKTASLEKGMEAAEFISALEEICGKGETAKIWKFLRESGLVIILTLAFGVLELS